VKRLFVVALALLAPCWSVFGQQVGIVKNDIRIDGLDPGIKIFLREKMAQGNSRFANDNIVLFLHGATGPSTCDFDLQYKDYSWADWLVKRGYVVYMGDYRNYGGSTREPTMDEPASKNLPVTRSYLALRDIEAMVNYIKRTRNVQKVTLIGWSWGAMMGGYYASLHSENVQKLVMYAPLYDFNDHTNLGPGSGLQNKRKTDPTSNSRTPPSLRAPNGVLEDSFYQATGRRLWHAANIYAPTLVIAGQFDTWSFSEDREGLMRDLVHAPVKKSVLIPDATHFVLFEKNRMQFFEEILKFMKE
jgi:pimeloyl-ACP methyl ester carboxylesterase